MGKGGEEKGKKQKGERRIYYTVPIRRGDHRRDRIVIEAVSIPSLSSCLSW